MILEPTLEPAVGNPDPSKNGTSFVERQNLSVRMECKRFGRLMLFSKKLANLKVSVALHYAHYNFACGFIEDDARYGRWRDDRLWSLKN